VASLSLSDSLGSLQSVIQSEAVAICRGRRSGNLHDPAVVHLRGVLAMQAGHLALAGAYLTRAIQLDPSRPLPLNDLGDVLSRQGRKEEALAAHLRAISLQPYEVERYVRLARGLSSQNLPREVAAVVREALRLAPDRGRLHAALGDALHAQNRADQAIQHYLEAVRLAPDDAHCHLRLGWAWLKIPDLSKALAAFQVARTLREDLAEAHIGLGETLIRLGAFREAYATFYSALAISPTDVLVNQRFVFVTELLLRNRDAVEAWFKLAGSLEMHGRLEEAAAAYRQVISRRPEGINARRGLARVQMSQGRVSAAIAELETVVHMDPDHTAAHIQLGLALQQAGEIVRGWNDLASHHHPRAPHWRHVEQPVWDGTAMGGRTVLLWSDDENSLSDTILFLRYIQFARHLDARVIVECEPTLVPLVRSTGDVEHVVATHGPLLPYDFHAPLMYLPALVPSARSADIGVPYLRVKDAARLEWQQRVRTDDSFLLGIAWAGTWMDREPPIIASLLAFEPLAGLRDTRIISLQFGVHEHELLGSQGRLVVERFAGAGHSLVNIAAIIVNLDLVITVDSTIAHLAGALGVPVWNLVPSVSPWPWPAYGDSTTWYPTMRICRQTQAGDWMGLVENVRTRLADTHASPSLHQLTRRTAASQ
jgi:tetratricopeptide (TPR) repeat protein